MLSEISEDRLRTLLKPYVMGLPHGVVVPGGMYRQLQRYLELLVRWNARTNLTAIREPEEMVRRHFGESVFAGGVLAGVVGEGREVLDLGSGAGFPGLPIQLLLPELRVTLAESQGKKVAFLREVVRELGVGAEVWAGRVEGMPEERGFHAVVMRAVDRMGAMEQVGRGRLRAGGVLLRLTTEVREGVERVEIPGVSGSFVEVSRPV
ncbi:MAG TPA: 16S rRNA (guanine(527)-N(7))-methyltransferase RsmG [Acidobacteriaceae bacterium]|nr:16S rRNA (guanine(527)-N(7))-methyltransferase RsmG [Acidobacteriaceae bacterium]